MIGLPSKNNVTHPIYPWQQEIFNSLQQHKLIAILKARGVGASEFLLRYALWLCLKDNKMQGKNISIVTGIRENLSLELLNRFRNLLPTHDWGTGSSSHVAEINSCRVIGYPSKRIKDLRGLTDTKLVICDEFAFFDSADKSQVLPVLEALQAKSDPTICLLSTAGPIGDEFHSIFQQPASTCRYKRLYIPIQKALGTLISKEEAAKVRRQGNYEQEFELKFGSYGQNSLFSLGDIDYCVRQSAKYDYSKLNHQAVEVFAIGVDPGWGSSKTGLAMVCLYDGKVHTLLCEEYEKADEDYIIQKILRLRQKTGRPQQTKIFADASAPGFIRRLKGAIPGERTDFENYIDYLRKHRMLRTPQEMEIVHYMSVVPVSFSKWGP
jgi:hypothetical protein